MLWVAIMRRKLAEDQAGALDTYILLDPTKIEPFPFLYIFNVRISVQPELAVESRKTHLHLLSSAYRITIAVTPRCHPGSQLASTLTLMIR